MKIVDRKTFLAMPRGTLFAKVRAGCVDELRMKLDTAGHNDFIYRAMIEVDASGSDEFFNMLWAACEERTRDELPLDWEADISRDGLYDSDQMFAVLGQEEVTNLIFMLTNARDGHI